MSGYPEVLESWERDWEPMIELVGTDMSDGSTQWGADRVELGSIRRYCEPIELSDPIHYDAQSARAAGWEDVVAPATAVMMYAIPPMWRPGEPTIFPSAEPDAQPARTPINNADPGPAPPTSGFFATDVEIEFLRAVVVGERLGRRGRKLLSVTPKQTRVGRGAFMTTESEIVSDRGDVVARIRTSAYAYNPWSEEEEEEAR